MSACKHLGEWIDTRRVADPPWITRDVCVDCGAELVSDTRPLPELDDALTRLGHVLMELPLVAWVRRLDWWMVRRGW